MTASASGSRSAPAGSKSERSVIGTQRGLDSYGIPARLLFQIGKCLHQRRINIQVAFDSEGEPFGLYDDEAFFARMLKGAPRRLFLSARAKRARPWLPLLRDLIDRGDPAAIEKAGFKSYPLGNWSNACIARLIDQTEDRMGLGTDAFLLLLPTTWHTSEKSIFKHHGGKDDWILYSRVPVVGEQIVSWKRENETEVSVELVINLPLGLHARPCAMLAKRMRDFDCDITISSRGSTANGKSMFDLLKLGADDGTILTITAYGPHAERAIQAASDLLSKLE